MNSDPGAALRAYETALRHATNLQQARYLTRQIDRLGGAN
jgi:hypothetical protein